VTGETMEAGEVLITECEVVAMYEGNAADGPPTFTLGYGACLGHNETKAISMAILDRALQKGMKDGPSNPSEDAEFVLLHVDGVDSMGSVRITKCRTTSPSSRIWIVCAPRRKKAGSTHEHQCLQFRFPR